MTPIQTVPFSYIGSSRCGETILHLTPVLTFPEWRYFLLESLDVTLAGEDFGVTRGLMLTGRMLTC